MQDRGKDFECFVMFLYVRTLLFPTYPELKIAHAQNHDKREKNNFYY